MASTGPSSTTTTAAGPTLAHVPVSASAPALPLPMLMATPPTPTAPAQAQLPCTTPAQQLAKQREADIEWFNRRQKEFLEIFTAEKNWVLTNDPQKEREFVFKKTGCSEQVVITVRNDDNSVVSFSGNAVAEIAQAATKYHESVHTEEKPIMFTLVAANQEQAMNFMRELRNGHFNINLIKSVKIDGRTLLENDITEMKEQLLFNEPVCPASPAAAMSA